MSAPPTPRALGTVLTEVRTTRQERPTLEEMQAFVGGWIDIRSRMVPWCAGEPEIVTSEVPDCECHQAPGKHTHVVVRTEWPSRPVLGQMVVNDEGMLHGLLYNPAASALLGEPVAGNCLVLLGPAQVD